MREPESQQDRYLRYMGVDWSYISSIHEVREGVQIKHVPVYPRHVMYCSCSSITTSLFMSNDLGPLHTQDWEPVTITLQALSLVEKADPVQVRCFTLRLRDQRSMCMQDGCKVDMDSYMVSNGLCFIVTWTISKNHLLEVGVTQNQETMALWTLITVDFFYFTMCEDPYE